MIRISKKADYGILLLTHIARQAARIGDHAGARAGETSAGGEIPLSAQELANAIPIGKSTIANLLKAFARAEILDSVRGVHGGYRLSRSPVDISLAQILEAIDGPISIVECSTFEQVEHAPCELTACCSTHHPMQLLQQRVVALLESITLDEFRGSCPVPNFVHAISGAGASASALSSRKQHDPLPQFLSPKGHS